MLRLVVRTSNEGAQRLREIADQLPDQLAGAVNQTAEQTQERLRQTAPLGKQVPGGRKPGGLRRSIRFDMEGTTATFEASAVAGYVIGGTDPHEITPRNAGSLHFWWENAGGFVNLMRVQHPGTEANDFRVPAVDQAAGDAEQVLSDLGDTILEGHA